MWVIVVYSSFSVSHFFFKLLKEISRKRRSIRYGREVELKPYIAAHFDVLPTEFTLGDDKHYGGFTNKQLQSGQEYVFFVLAVMEHAESVSSLSWHLFAVVFYQWTRWLFGAM